MTRLVVRGEHVVLPDGIRPAAIHVENGRIVGIARNESVAGVREFDAGTLVVLPGLVDSHVHVNEPGRGDWEGFETATRAAAAGGVTTIVDMPLNSVPPTTSVEGLRAKEAAASGRCHVDVAFWGGVVPGNAAELEPLAAAGVRGYKCFLSPSGVEEFQHVGERELRDALPILAGIGLPLLVHAERPDLLVDPPAEGDPRAYLTWLGSRPPDAEHGAIALLIRLAREYGAPIHIVHLASADALPALSAARAEGVPITVETCPHYLTFAAEEIREGATAFKCAPPIRERSHRERLWDALAGGGIDLVATDHSPAPPALKRLQDGDFLQAWGGIASLQLGLAAVWSGARTRGVRFERLADWMAAAPSRLAGLEETKGAVRPGADADFAVCDPDAAFTVNPSALHHRHPVTPYSGMTLYGVVRATFLRGELIAADGEVLPVRRGKMIGSRA